MKSIYKIILFCFILRVLALFYSGLPEPDSAQARWYEISCNVADGNGFVYCQKKYFPFCNLENNKTAVSSPIPILVYSFFIKYFNNDSVLLIYLFQMILGLISVYFFYMLALNIIKIKSLALFGSFLWGTYFPAISLERYLLGGPIATYLLIIGIYYFSEAFKTRNILFWILSGVLIGLSALSRSPLVYFPFLLIPLVGKYSQSNFKLGINFLFFLCSFIIVLFPWALKNKKDFGFYKAGTTMNGYNLYRFNYVIKFEDYYKRPWQSTKEFSNEFNGFLASNKFLNGTENEIEMDKHYLNKGLKYIKNHPFRYLLIY